MDVSYNFRVPKNLGVAILLVVASLAFQSCFITLDAFVSDEGIVLVAADDVAHGRLLYRDISVPLTPAVYLLQGLAFKIFGSSLLVSRALVAIVYASSVVAVFALALCFVPRRKAAIAGSLAIPLQVWMWPHAQYFSYNTLAILLCLVALRAAWSIERGPHRIRSALVFGAVLAAALWVKPNLPVAIGAGVLLYWLTGWLRSAIGLPCARDRGFADLLGEGLATLAGIALASLPMVVYLAINGIFDDFIRSVTLIAGIYGDSPVGLFPSLFPLTEQIDAVRMSQDLVVPGMLANGTDGLAASHAYQYLIAYTGWIDLAVRVVYYLPVALYLATAATLGHGLWRRSWSQRDEAALFTFFGAVLLYLTIISFPAVHYMTPTLLPLVALTVFVYSRFEPSTAPVLKRIHKTLGFAAVGAFLAASFAALFVYLGIPRAPVHTPRGTFWVGLSTARLWNEILDYTESALSEEDQIFAVPYFPLFYFMSERDHPTRYVALGPGLPGMEAEDEIIGYLEHNGVDFVLSATGVEYPGLEGFESSYPRLHHYLTTRFALDRRFEGRYRTYAKVLRRVD